MGDHGLSLFDAWAAWAGGIDIRSRLLWGLEIYWWARIAKVATLIGGLIIILDIIGPERIQRYLDERKNHAPSRIGDFVMSTLIALSLLLFLFGGGALHQRDPGAGPYVFLICGYIVGGVLWSRYGGRTEAAIVRTIVKIFDHSAVFKYTRIISLVLLLSAFHFDLLAS
ncbi:hypothetical protein [Nonomuraea sp. NPDC003754]